MAISLGRASIALAAACFAGILAGIALQVLSASGGWYFAFVLGISGLAVLRVVAPAFGFARPRRFVAPSRERAVTDAKVVEGASARANEPRASVTSADVSYLWAEYKTQHSERARERLVVAYSPLVKYVAGRMSSGLPANVEEPDLFSYGLVGLIDAIERFDAKREGKFETYAISRIKGAILEELEALDWVPLSVRALAQAIERANSRLEHRLHRAPTDVEMAQELKITVEEFQESLVKISNSTVVTLDALWAVTDSSGGDSSGDRVPPLDRPSDLDAPYPQELPNTSTAQDRLAAAMLALPERERLVIALFYYESLTLREIAEVLGVSGPQIAQLHSRAILSLGRDLSSRVLEDAYEVSRDHSPEATRRRPWLTAASSL